MFLGNLVLIVLNLPKVKLAKILLIPRWIQMPVIAILSIVEGMCATVVNLICC